MAALLRSSNQRSAARSRAQISAFAVALLAFAVAGSSVLAEDEIDFNRDIRRILSDRCIACHGPDAAHRKANLRLDKEDDAKLSAIVEESAADSEMVVRISTDDPELKMPPPKSGKKLSAKEIDLLRRWIDEGAQWAPHWAYVKPKPTQPPAVKNTHWGANSIDRYILAKLEAKGVAPSPAADRVTLIRRLTFDLTGLPPTYAEVEAFANSQDPAAYEKLVDRLLASPRFGERMAVYWLDLVRYADTVGYHGDQDHNISPYRDWVINAFNDDLPLDAFCVEQLAGDLLPDATLENRVASGYNRLLQTSHEGGVQPKEYLAIYAADRVRNVSGVWMGATLGCAQCHDHKFDPFQAKDFYSMAAMFADIDEAQHFKVGSNALPTRRPPEIAVLDRAARLQLAQVENDLASVKEELETTDDITRLKALQAELTALAQLKKSLDAGARSSMVSVAIEPREIRLLPRGNWLDDTGPVMSPAAPAFLGKVSNDGERATRLDLARWLTDREEGVGGLTARVFANRFWYLMMGSGFSRVLDDFGGQGEPPSHPQLLDALALQLINDDWDIKQSIRRIALSSTYQQSSAASAEMLDRDPYNRLFARQSRYRLPAEMVRDNALEISGLLIHRVGGPSVKPYQPAGYYRHLNFPQRKYAASTDQNQWRRGVYMHWQRQFLHPMLKALDAPSREECTASRPRSNTPLAALTLLNDVTFVEAARVFAERILNEAESDFDNRLEFAFREALSRKPDAAELKLLKSLHAETQTYFADHAEDAARLLGVGRAVRDSELNAAEQAAWTVVCRAILNLHETNQRS